MATIAPHLEPILPSRAVPMAHKALLVGINDYSPSGSGGPDLRGCVNDVRDMANTITSLGVVLPNPTALRILTDARATRSEILKGLQWLLAGAGKGEHLIFHYSGHGSQVVDTSGDEPDRKDETICPHDFASSGMITDDDLRRYIDELPAGVRLDVMLDSCHSGSGTREKAAMAMLPEGDSVRYRYVAPPLDYGFFLDANPSLPTRRLLQADSAAGAAALGLSSQPGSRELVTRPINHVLWAGCRANQTSAEVMIDGVYRGVFTYQFCKVLRGAGLAITRARLDAQVSINISGMGHSQIPQLEGPASALAAKVFS